MNFKKQFLEGLLTKNPVTVQLLGMCSTLAITTSLFNGLGMGAAVTIILICSNVLISALRKVIPNEIRIAAYITIIAGFVTIVQMLVKAFLPSIDAALGIFLPLIVVNCIILARAEMFAAKNPVLPSILDGLGMGVGFTATLTAMGIIRELIGAGTIFSIPITANFIDPMLVMILPPGGFFVFGVLVAVSNALAKKKGKPVVESIGCSGCSENGSCPFAGDAEKCEKPAKEEIKAVKEEAKEEKPSAEDIKKAKAEAEEAKEELKETEEEAENATPSAEDGKGEE